MICFQYPDRTDEKSYQEADVCKDSSKLHPTQQQLYQHSRPKKPHYASYDQFRPSFVSSSFANYNEYDSYKNDLCGEESYRGHYERYKRIAPKSYPEDKVRYRDHSPPYIEEMKHENRGYYLEEQARYSGGDNNFRTYDAGGEDFREYPEEARLAYGLNSHQPYKPFACDVCGKRFQIKWSVTRHKREIHCDNSQSYTDLQQGTKVFVCTICGKTYGYSFNLKRHIRQAHPPKTEKVPVVTTTTMSTRQAGKEVDVKPNNQMDNRSPEHEDKAYENNI